MNVHSTTVESPIKFILSITFKPTLTTSTWITIWIFFFYQATLSISNSPSSHTFFMPFHAHTTVHIYLQHKTHSLIPFQNKHRSSLSSFINRIISLCFCVCISTAWIEGRKEGKNLASLLYSWHEKGFSYLSIYIHCPTFFFSHRSTRCIVYWEIMMRFLAFPNFSI